MVSAIFGLMGAALAVTLGTFALAGCSKSSDAGNDAAAALGPCDPLTPTAVTLGAILGAGEDPQLTFYLADQAATGQGRVFVSEGGTLYRQHVAGSGGSSPASNADYTFSFQDPLADASDLRALLIQVRDAAVSAMALGPGNSRNPYTPDAGDELLTVVDAGAIAGFKIQNLPVQVEYVADVSNGDAIVITEPMDPWTYSGFRLFYGTSNQMIERPIITYNRTDTSDDIAFTVDGATYTAHFTFPSLIGIGPDGSIDTAPPGPESLAAGAAGTLPMTERTPTPPTLSGFAFSCLGL